MLSKEDLGEPLNVKHEPEVEYFLILSNKVEEPRKKSKAEMFNIKQCSVNVLKFDANLEGKSRLRDIWYACNKCEFFSRQKRELKMHTKEFHPTTRPIECAACRIKFWKRTLWKQHKEEHHKDGLFKCDQCSFVGTQMQTKNHNQSHTRPFSCDTCDRKFSWKPHLKNHQMQHGHGSYAGAILSLQCNQCSKTFRTPPTLRQHVASVHRAVTKMYECDICGKLSNVKGKISSHILTHFNEECSFCGRIVSKSNMMRHLKLQHIKSEDGRICQKCKTRFLTKQTYDCHINAKPRECILCKITIKCRTIWLQHVDEQHSEGFNCDQCSFARKSVRSFNQHYKKHVRKFSCESCSGMFRSKEHLRGHQLQHQHGAFAGTNTWHRCKQCDKSYRAFESLRSHERNIHGRKLECDLCGKVVNGKPNMRDHLKSHVKTECEFCGKIFNKRSISYHLKKAHMKSEWVCKNCDKKFVNKCDYLRHLKARPIKCLSCQITFKCLQLWERHEKEHRTEGFSAVNAAFLENVGTSDTTNITANQSRVLCGERFAFKRQLRDHSTKQHKS